MVINRKDRDPQDVVDAAPPDAIVRGDPATEHAITAPFSIETEGLTVDGLSLRLADGASAIAGDRTNSDTR